MEALDSAEDQYGYEHVRRVDLTTFTAGLPVFVIVRMPEAGELRMFQDLSKTRKDGSPGDAVGAAVKLGLNCIVYPAKDIVAKLPAGVSVCAGTVAAAMCAAKEKEEGKD